MALAAVGRGPGCCSRDCCGALPPARLWGRARRVAPLRDSHSRRPALSRRHGTPSARIVAAASLCRSRGPGVVPCPATSAPTLTVDDCRGQDGCHAGLLGQELDVGAGGGWALGLGRLLLHGVAGGAAGLGGSEERAQQSACWHRLDESAPEGVTCRDRIMGDGRAAHRPSAKMLHPRPLSETRALRSDGDGAGSRGRGPWLREARLYHGATGWLPRPAGSQSSGRAPKAVITAALFSRREMQAECRGGGLSAAEQAGRRSCPSRLRREWVFLWRPPGGSLGQRPRHQPIYQLPASSWRLPGKPPRRRRPPPPTPGQPRSRQHCEDLVLPGRQTVAGALLSSQEGQARQH